MDSQVQYAMSEDTNTSYGTAPGAAMSNGQPIIAKTGTTEYAQSAFFVGAIPSQALTVAMFTSQQNDCKTTYTTANCQTLNYLGGNSQGGYGGTWPAAIWHTYAENMFVPLGVESFQPAVFTGQTWNQVPPNLRKWPSRRRRRRPARTRTSGGGQNPTPPSTVGNPNPYPTYPAVSPSAGDLRSRTSRGHLWVGADAQRAQARLDRTVEDARPGTPRPMITTS